MPNLETLNIFSFSEMVNTPMMTSKFLHLKSLNIILGGQAYDLLSLVSFFDASPSLESFILNALPAHVECVSIFVDPSCLRMVPGHHHDKLKHVEIINFSSAKGLVELTCYILESTTSLECLTLDTTHGLRRCSDGFHKCVMMRKEALVEANWARLVAQTYINMKVPSTTELKILEPCSQCHAVEL